MHEKKTVIITGAAGLMGTMFTEALIEEGHTVIGVDINVDSLNRLEEVFCEKASKERLFIKQVDICDENSQTELVSYLRYNNHNPSVLINNAACNPMVGNDGINKKSRIEEYDKETWQAELNVGLTGAFLCVKHLMPLMLEISNDVHIINIGSDLGTIPPDQNLYIKPESQYGKEVKPFSYSMIKAGLHGLTLYLSTYDNHGRIRANTLSPGGIANNQPSWFVERLNKLIPAGRMANKDEYKEVIKFLVSNGSSYLNGQNIVMNGGRH